MRESDQEMKRVESDCEWVTGFVKRKELDRSFEG